MQLASIYLVDLEKGWSRAVELIYQIMLKWIEM